jgi:hypothetical protein
VNIKEPIRRDFKIEEAITIFKTVVCVLLDSFDSSLESNVGHTWADKITLFHKLWIRGSGKISCQAWYWCQHCRQGKNHLKYIKKLYVYI